MDNGNRNKPSYEELLLQNEKLKVELNTLKRLVFGQKRERYVPEQEENQLDFLRSKSSSSNSSSVQKEQITYTRRKAKKKPKKHPIRQALPAHLPRHDIIIQPDEDVSKMKKIGQEETEELDYEPPRFYVNRYIRPKYARPNDEGIVIGTLPSRPIEKGIAGPGVLAQLLISKYVDHLPLYRQRQQFKRLGVELAESTLCGWKEKSYELIKPLVDLIQNQVLNGSYIMVDETTIKVLDPQIKGKTHLGYYWVYFDPLRKQAFYHYHKSRSREGPSQLLKNFSGFLQSDGYQVYDEFAAKDSITAIGCMAHARRYFNDARLMDSERADWMLFRIQKLYAIERYARRNQLSFEKRYEERQKTSLPIMQEMKQWLDEQVISALPQSAIGKAIRYMLKRWPYLENYLLDGRLEIDNNLVENAIRPIALGRKNYLFAGSHDGAQHAAAIYTLVTSAKLYDINPFSYLKDVLARISDHPHKKLDQLLPKNWVKSKTTLTPNI